MAIVTAPLFSFGARGKLAKSLVYLGWKGLATVRQYVVPANPNSTGQATQRGYFGAAVAAWQGAGWNAADLAAWNAKAALAASPRSGFNEFCSGYIGAKVAGYDVQVISSIVVSNEASNGFNVAAAGTTGKTYKIYYGTSPTQLTLDSAVVNTSGALTVSLTGLASSTKYYFQIRNTAANEWDITGIGNATTTAGA